MAGGAFSFAEILRDEYIYLHGASPCIAAKFEEKHLRELPHLILRIKAAPPAKAASPMRRESFLAAYCDFSGDERKTKLECATVTAAFKKLLESQYVEIGEEPGVTLYEALLRDPDAAVGAALRDPEVLRKLLQIQNARRIVFRDREAAKVIGGLSELRDIVAADSGAIRVIAAADGGCATLRAYPPLLATIADDAGLAEMLCTDEATRTKLIREFGADRRKWYSRLLSLGRPKHDDETLWKIAGNSHALTQWFHGRIETGAALPEKTVPAADLAAFNSIVLETAFPDYFTDSYDVRALNTALHETDTAAICLSGGGIRSATFNLGVLQGLADHGLLTKFHYISTVSGGGYIGSWFSSWIRRHTKGVTGVAEDLCAPPADPEEPEARPIRHLREYSSYLAPRSASLSADTWTLVATYVRNLLLNWMILLPAIAVVLILPRLLEAAAYAATLGQTPAWTAKAAFVLTAVAIFAVALLRPKNEKKSGRPPTSAELRLRKLRSSAWLTPLLGASVAFCIYWASLTTPPPILLLARLLAGGSAAAGVLYVAIHLFSLAAGGTLLQRIAGAARLFFHWKIFRHTLGEVASAAAAGFIAGALLQALFTRVFKPETLTTSVETLYFEQFVCFGIPLFLLAFFAEATLLVGLTTLRTNDHDREWLARSAALILLAGFIWMVGAMIAIVLPFVLALLPLLLTSVGGISGATSWVLSKSAKLRSKEQRETTSAQVIRAVLHLAAAVTVVVLLAALSLLVTGIASKFAYLQPTTFPAVFEKPLTDVASLHLRVLHQSSPRMLVDLAATALAFAVLISLLLEVNIYSMHGMYRNRLIRAYLGASRWFRRPDPFTGFDPQDNVDMFELRSEALWTSSYINFDGLVDALAGHEKIMRQLPTEFRSRLEAYRFGPQRPPKEEIRSELTRALNELMATNDIRNGVPAPPSITLFIENRRYLDGIFPDLIVPAPVDPPRMKPPSPKSPPQEPPDKVSEAVAAAPSKEEAEIIHSDDEQVIYDRLRRLAELDWEDRARPPLHIVNTALNLVGGDNLAWQERKADSFTISPLHAGNRRIGYRDAFRYGKHISLGTSLAISGAALSPNMGEQSSPALTFLMTLFNARLGWWLGNPSKDTHQKRGPTSTLQSLLSEMTGSTNDTSDYVFLSDGGHFDNLGLYEMVRRRCRYIIVSDATADGDYAFTDLGNAVRKIRVDMGIPITLRTSYLPPGPEEKVGRYCARGLIEYGNVDDVPFDPVSDPEVAEPEDGDKKRRRRHFGYLLYIKPAVRDDCPPDVRTYKKESTSFPHETTIDQFFCESQFESYRALGRHVIGKICVDRLGRDPKKARGIAEFLFRADQYVAQEAVAPLELKLWSPK